MHGKKFINREEATTHKNAPDKRRGLRKCLHNGIILIVICFQNKYRNK